MIPPAPKPWRLALASRSPRRIQLLHEAGFDPIVLETGIDDTELQLGPVSAEESAVALAYFKAAAGAASPGARGCVVLAADTFVVKNHQILGKPRDKSDADRILRLLSNGEHDVLTGVAIIDNRPEATASPHAQSRRYFLLDRAAVRVGTIPNADRLAYLSLGQWLGKAGAYNLSERLDAGWPIEFTGDPTTIMGLPMRRLTPLLHTLAEAPSPLQEPVRP